MAPLTASLFQIPVNENKNILIYFQIHMDEMN